MKRGWTLGLVGTIAAVLMTALLGGCAGMGRDSGRGEGEKEMSASAAAAKAESMPYFIENNQDIPIPREMEWVREESMSIKTESFAGGTLTLTGRVDAKSLADFFVTSMTKNGWKLVGSVTYKNILLAFTKPHRTCTMAILDTNFASKTRVSIYITDDISARSGFAPFGAETLK